MYVRVGLYFLDIILDIALIQRLPKLEKMRCPRTCGRRVVEDKKEREKKKYLRRQRDYNIQHL